MKDVLDFLENKHWIYKVLAIMILAFSILNINNIENVQDNNSIIFGLTSLLIFTYLFNIYRHRKLYRYLDPINNYLIPLKQAIYKLSVVWLICIIPMAIYNWYLVTFLSLGFIIYLLVIEVAIEFYKENQLKLLVPNLLVLLLYLIVVISMNYLAPLFLIFYPKLMNYSKIALSLSQKQFMLLAINIFVYMMCINLIRDGLNIWANTDWANFNNKAYLLSAIMMIIGVNLITIVMSNLSYHDKKLQKITYIIISLGILNSEIGIILIGSIRMTLTFTVVYTCLVLMMYYCFQQQGQFKIFSWIDQKLLMQRSNYEKFNESAK